jgi:hypothetical protein
MPEPVLRLYLGLLDDAAPMLRDAQGVPHAGALLALPALLATGVLDTAREVWGSAFGRPKILDDR